MLTEVFAQGVDKRPGGARRDRTHMPSRGFGAQIAGEPFTFTRPRHAHPAEAHGFRAQYPEITEGVPAAEHFYYSIASGSSGNCGLYVSGRHGLSVLDPTSAFRSASSQRRSRRST